jgi:O-antigen/teichoic acid export membrane protein
VKTLPEVRTNSFSGNALLIFLIRFFPSLANALVVIYFSQQLSIDDYGNYQNFWVRLAVLNTVACLGFQAFIVTYTPTFIVSVLRQLRVKYYYAFGVWLTIISGVFAYLQYKSTGMSFYVPFSFLIIYSLSVIAESLLISFKDYKWLLGVNKVYTLLFLLLHMALVDGSFSMEQLFLSLLVLGVCRLLIFIYLLRKRINASETEEHDKVLLLGARSLWMHIGVYDISQMLFRWIDKFAITFLFAEQVSAIYFNGSIDIPFLPLLLGAAGSAALIQMAGQKEKNDTAYTINLVHHSSRLLSAIVFPAFFFLLFYRYELFSVLLSEKYIAAVPIFLVSIMALPLRAYSFTTVLQNRHKGAIINTGAITDLLIACALMYPLYLLMGLPGVALSFVISSYLQAGYYLYHTAKVLGVNIIQLVPLGNWLWKLIVFALLFIAFHYLCSLYFTAQIVLFSGMLLAAIACAAGLWLEYRAKRTF